MLQLTPVNLYGGAINVSLPADFLDVSSIRQVPDNQEVYLSRTGFTSIVFDLTERVERDVLVRQGHEGEEKEDEDERALRYHFDDMLDEADRRGNGVVVWSCHRMAMASINLPTKTSTYTLFATVSHQQQQQQQQQQHPSTAILLTLLRLEAQKTDVVITINVPLPTDVPVFEEEDNNNSRVDTKDNDGGNKSKMSSQLKTEEEKAVQTRDEILKSLEINDWSVFGSDGDVA